MADDAIEAEDGESEKKKGGKGGLIGILLAVLLGGGGFYASFSGLIPGMGGDPEVAAKKPMPVMVAQPMASFLPLDELVISLGPRARAKHLKLSAQLEIDPAHMEEVTNNMPRILDVLNTYLRAVDEADIESPAAMTRIRAHMLRRIQIVTGEGRVKDLLITEFVLN